MQTGKRPRVGSAITVPIVLVLVAAACAGPTSNQEEPKTGAEEPTKGGTLVLGASQEPNCADWFVACGNSSWGRDMMGSQTLPSAFDFVDEQYRPSPLLAGEPVLDKGPPQRVTYRINPQAVWSDGAPITAADFRYTSEQARLAGFGSFAAPFSSIESVDDSDLRTAVVSFKEPTAAWRDVFRFILPRHLLEGRDRTAEMRDGYRFSGGPWIIDHWTRGQEIKLIPNPTYWGAKPRVDAVVFKIISDAAAYLQAYKTGQIDMAYVQGAQPQVTELKALPNTNFDVNIGLTFEFVMFNTERPPLDSSAVRQALSYATDREAIVSQLSGPLLPGVRPPQAFMSPGNRRWYSEPFKKYVPDHAKVAELMTGDGWARDADGVWTKGGSRARVELNTHAGNRRRELTQQIIQSQWQQAGFEVTVNNTTVPTLGGDWLPKGTFHAAIFGISPSTTDPNRCQTFCSRSIPTEANGYQGSNVSRISSKALDDAWQAVATELDDAKRVELVHQAEQIVAEEVPVLPLSPVLDIIVYNTEKVGGPVTANPSGVFFNLNEWYCRSASCRP